jgi:probable lipoprotein NlpC
MHWSDRFVGLPHAERGRGPVAFDCLGLLIRVQSDVFGRAIEDPGCSMAQGLHPRNRAILERQVVEVPADATQPGDALLFRVGGRALHVGTVINAQLMLHSYRFAATVESWVGPSWSGKLVGIYRFV